MKIEGIVANENRFRVVGRSNRFAESPIRHCGKVHCR